MFKAIRMDNEYYQIEVEFDVSMSQHNYERGNLYVQSKFNSYKQGVKPFTLARSGFLDPKSSLTIKVKEAISMIPFLSYFLSCEPI